MTKANNGCRRAGVREALTDRWRQLRSRPISSDLLFPGRDSSLFAQAVRQIINGVTTSVLDITIFQILIWGRVNIFLAATISTLLGLVLNFSIARWYVFSAPQQLQVPAWKQFGRYLLTCVGSLGIIQAMLLIFASLLKFHPTVVKLMCLPVIYVYGLLISRRFVFKP